MTVYKYSNGLFGPKVKGYENDKRRYDIQATKEGLAVYSKDGKLLHQVADTKENEIFVHTLRDCLGVQEANKKTKHNKFVLIYNNEIIKEATFTGELSPSSGVIVGKEDLYFKKFVGLRGNRFYFQIVKDKDYPVTPKCQVISHEAQDDGLDRFYCENYRELSNGEFLEEDDEEYRNNLEEIAVYLGNGREFYHQLYNEQGEATLTQEQKDFNTEMLLGASLVPLSPLAGSAVMLNAALKKKRREEEASKKQETPESQNEDTFGME